MNIKSKIFSTVALCALGLTACGGDSSNTPPTTPPVSAGPALTVSPASLTFSGKQFADPPAQQAVVLTYSRDVVSSIDVSANVNELLRSGSEDIFRAGTDSSQQDVFVNILNTSVEGGTYVEEMVLTPNLQAGGTGTPVSVSLTLVQEPTTPITLTQDIPTIEITEGGPPVRFKVTVNAGNTVRWGVGPFRFVADDIDAVTSDPTEGIGSQEIDIVVNPTPAFVESISQFPADGETVEISFQDLDAPFNVGFLNFNVTLAE